jgi:putative phage-type endonuclease
MSKTQQRTSEWFASRKGKVTGSIAGAILGLSPHLTRDAVMRRMVRDWHGAEKEGNQTNVAMEYGTMNESIAQLAYTKKTGNLVHEVGFLHSPIWLGQKLEWLGASPDGIVEDDNEHTRVLEIKCPFGLRNDKEPVFKSIMEQPHYYAQLQIEMLCADKFEADFYQWSQYGDMLETVFISPLWIKKTFHF